jgi:hypothetical protein
VGRQKTRRPKAGDVLEVRFTERCAYLYYLGRHTEYGDAIRVLDCAALTSQERLEDLVSEGYETFYPVLAAVSQGLAIVVAHTDSALGMPLAFRRAGARAKDGTVLAWIIEENGTERLTRKLSRKERALPIAAIWNHEMLRIRIVEGWRPGEEV